MDSNDTMTDTEHTDLAEHVDDHGAHADEHRHKEPSDRQYIWIAIILAVLTALEILSTEIGPDGSWLVPMLILLMVVKFWIVASFFMHLRFDSRLFGFLFYLGLGFAVVLYAVMLATFHFWTS